ncbi:MAG: PAS domain S-box protein [Candidatus Omnitrophota bacterium]
MRVTYLKVIKVLFCLMFFQVLLLAPSDSDAAGQKNILVLHSYHQGYKWTDDEQRGIMAALGPMVMNSRLYFEYMGTKWVADAPFFEQLRDVLKRRYANMPPDVIIATDNDAFNFLRKYRNEMFGEVPVVFCGVNWFKPEDLQGQSLYTGVNEDADIKAGLDLMLRLHPRTKDVYVIADLTTTGQAIHRELQEAFPFYQGRVAFHVLDDLLLPEVLDKVSRLSGDSIVFITIFQKDKSGKFFEFNEIAEKVSQSSKVPVYGLWDFHLGYGIIGGMLTSGYAQGTAAGEIALRVLNGVSPDAIPVVMKSPNRYMFDHLQLRRFGIDQVNLPAGSIVINEPASFYQDHKGLVWSVLAVFLFLSGMVVVLLVNIHRRRLVEGQLRQAQAGLEDRVKERTDALNKEKELLRESEASYRNQFAMNSAVMLLIDPEEGVIVDANAAASAFYGYTPEKILAMKISDINMTPPAELKQALASVMPGSGKRFHFQHRLADGSLRTVESAGSYIQFGARRLLHSIVFDITDRQKMEIALREQMDQVVKMNKYMVDREVRVIELKKEVNALCKEFGRPEPYAGGVS